MSATVDDQVRDEVYRSKLPALPEDRIYSGFSHTMTAIAWSIATWLFVMGAAMATAAPLWAAIVATFFGCVVPLVFQSLLSKYFARWGIDTAFGSRATFGQRGAKVVVMIFGIIPAWCWISLPAVMFGRSVQVVLGEYGVTGWIANDIAWGFVAMGIGLFITYKGPRWMRWAFNIATPVMLLLILIVTIRVLLEWPLSEIAAVQPDGFVDNPHLSYVFGIEMAIGLGVSWLFQFAAYGRICKSEAGAFYGSFIGWGILWATLAIPAMIVTYMTGASDPVEGLAQVGGSWMVIWLLMLCIANPASLATNGYLVALTLRNFFPKLPWIAAVGVNFLVLVLVLFPVVYDEFGKFMAILATFTVSWAAVWVLDVVLRKYKLDLKGLYDETSSSPYWYYKGFNPWTLIAVAAGTATSLIIWTPWTYAVHLEGLFQVLGGSVPGAFVAGVVYYVLRRLFLVPKRVGLPETRSPVALGVAAPQVAMSMSAVTSEPTGSEAADGEV